MAAIGCGGRSGCLAHAHLLPIVLHLLFDHLRTGLVVLLVGVHVVLVIFVIGGRPIR